jgi:hypothetical protein
LGLAFGYSLPVADHCGAAFTVLNGPFGNALTPPAVNSNDQCRAAAQQIYDLWWAVIGMGGGTAVIGGLLLAVRRPTPTENDRVGISRIENSRIGNGRIGSSRKE